ncbi:hypothetical protein LUZ61_001358 [Rhynchospora tenuis]|uniref:Cytochrome b561 domain-containing protein n=1 Tax=Rhynchospora tenuis TaxID=198213 RepID=A0AAD5ZGW7_9POAL|nr:hypothetical protein LUZ61_001358 [Rhynchospora tenuis]
MALVGSGASMVLFARHVTTVAHILALIVAILMIVWIVHYEGGANINSQDPNLVFNVHPLVMSLGFILMIGEAIMAYKTFPMEKIGQKFMHMMLQLFALVLGIFGVYVAFKYHGMSDSQNMTTLHSWLGICTICLFGLQWLFGFLLFWFPRAPPMTREMAAPLHVTAGIAIFLMTICTAETGLMEKSIVPNSLSEGQIINFTGLFILLFGVAVTVTIALRRISL